jgi:hypothetical protein
MNTHVCLACLCDMKRDGELKPSQIKSYSDSDGFATRLTRSSKTPPVRSEITDESTSDEIASCACCADYVSVTV